MESDICAGIFGKIFKLLAHDPITNKELAKDVWDLTHDYEFDYFVMGCDSALELLELAERDSDGLIHYKI
jgi:hypothetical protein